MNPIKWIRRIFSIRDDELMLKCGLDGYFFIRFLRAIIIIFFPLMVVLVIVLLPINYHKGRGGRNYTYSDVRLFKFLDPAVVSFVGSLAKSRISSLERHDLTHSLTRKREKSH